MKQKIKVLELNRKFLVWLGVCSTTSNHSRTSLKINYILVLLLQVFGLLSSIWFICTFIRIDLNSVLYAGFHTSAYSTSTYSLLVGFVFQHKIMATFEELQTIFDNCKLNSLVRFNLKFDRYLSTFSDHLEDPRHILIIANRRGEWITTNFMRYLTLGYLFSSILLAVLSALYSFYSNGFIAVEELYVPFKFM